MRWHRPVRALHAHVAQGAGPVLLFFVIALRSDHAPARGNASFCPSLKTSAPPRSAGRAVQHNFTTFSFARSPRRVHELDYTGPTQKHIDACLPRAGLALTASQFNGVLSHVHVRGRSRPSATDRLLGSSLLMGP